jgi:hypothetical protein
VPRFEFWFTDHDAIAWSFDRHPDIGEEVVLGDRGVYRVTGLRQAGIDDPAVDAEYTCERVRDASHEDIQVTLKRGVNRLPSR